MILKRASFRGGSFFLFLYFRRAVLIQPGFADRAGEPGHFHIGELLFTHKRVCACHPFKLFMNRMFYSQQKCALRLEFHPL
jgi:hypothetical protein